MAFQATCLKFVFVLVVQDFVGLVRTKNPPIWTKSHFLGIGQLWVFQKIDSQNR